MLTVRLFNTGRLYQRDGQWIGYAKLASLAPDFRTHLVAFCDHSRMVDGVVTIRGDVTDESVLRAYDAGGYGAAESGVQRALADGTRAIYCTLALAPLEDGSIPARKLAQSSDRTAQQVKARAYADRVSDGDSAPCKHGHAMCAAYEGGPCVDETLTEAGL